MYSIGLHHLKHLQPRMHSWMWCSFFFCCVNSIPEITNVPIQLCMMCTLEIKNLVEISPNLWGHLKGCDPLMLGSSLPDAQIMSEEWHWDEIEKMSACCMHANERRGSVFASVRTGEVLTEWKEEGPQTLSRAREDEPGVKVWMVNHQWKTCFSTKTSSTFKIKII